MRSEKFLTERLISCRKRRGASRKREGCHPEGSLESLTGLIRQKDEMSIFRDIFYIYVGSSYVVFIHLLPSEIFAICLNLFVLSAFRLFSS